MRKRRNGFTRFVKKLDGKTDRIDTSKFYAPLSFSPHTVQRLLRDLETTGSAELLSSCFTWDNTPQRHRYWCDIQVGLTVIDDEGLAYLHWLVEQ